MFLVSLYIKKGKKQKFRAIFFPSGTDPFKQNRVRSSSIPPSWTVRWARNYSWTVSSLHSYFDTSNVLFIVARFQHLIHLPEIQLYYKVVYNVLLRSKEGVEDAMSFKIGDQEIYFGEREFAMMSGLKFHGNEKIDHNPAEQIRLMKVHFPGQSSVKLGDLIEKFNQLPNNNEDKLKLGLLYIAEAAWIFLSIPVLKQAYSEENEDCPHALNPRILHLKRAYKLPSHHESRIDLSDVNIKVVLSLHPTPEEIKESYMSGLLSEAEVSRLKGHKKDSDIEELNDEDDSNEQWVANQYSNPSNSLDASGVKDKGLSNDGEASGANGPENDSGIQALNGDDDATKTSENNQYSNCKLRLNLLAMTRLTWEKKVTCSPRTK
ncbi:hypothetical protein MKX03_011313 [Papaver bracteatum]|nr:hypothetical protein MKX03_011313 [Papaver bracteatum]